MVAELILVPDSPELLDGAKSCARRVARAFSAVGIKVREQISLCSGKSDLQKAVSSALARSNIVVTIGGLSNECGNLTKTVLAQGLRIPIDTDPDCYGAIQDYCRRSGDPFLPGDGAYAQIPRGSRFFLSQYGKVPALVISSAKQHIIMLPIGEQEAITILSDDILPYLHGTAEPKTVTRTLRTYGVSEEMVRRTLAEVMGAPNPAVTVHKEGNEVLVRVTGRDSGTQQAAAICTPVLQKIVDLLGDAAYGLDVESLQAAVVDKMRKKNLGLAVAESGSSGMMTRVLSETNGGAEVLRYTVFVEDDAAKKERLGISSKLLRKHGGVSEQAAVAMANAARIKSDAPLAVALTVGGQSKDSSPGVVYIAVCDEINVYVKKLVVGTGDPAEQNLVLDAALSRALNMVRLFVDYLPGRYMGAVPLSEALAGRTVTDLPQSEGFVEVEGEGAQPGFFKRFLGNFIIRKADGPGVKVRKVIFIIAMLVFLGSAGYLGKYAYDTWAAKRLAMELQNMFLFGEDMEDFDFPEDYPSDYLPKFGALYARNPDVVGYISIPDTLVAYPVVQAADNDYYLRKDYNQKSNDHGIPFMDWRVDVKEPSDNMVIYGHNMKDGQIFGEILYYSPYHATEGGETALEYFKEHPIIDFATVYEENKYKIFSIFITNAYDNQGPVFDYHNFIDAQSDADFMEYVRQLEIRSLISTGVDVEPGDKLITLSTCSYEFKDARFVVVARQLRRGESADFDAPDAAINRQPLMPDIWYQLYGGSRPSGLNAGASVTTSPTTVPSSSTPAVSQAVSQSSSQQSSRQEESSRTEETSRVETAPPPDTSSSSSSRDSSSSTSSSRQESSAPPESSVAESSQPESSQPESSEPESSIPEVSQEESSTPQEPEESSRSEPSVPEQSQEDETNTENGADTNQMQIQSLSASNLSQVSVTAGGKVVKGDALDIVARSVQNEIGSSFHKEAIKAQAVAVYTYITFYNQSGSAPAVILAAKADKKVTDAVSEILGEAVYYNNKVALTPYYATSAGYTNSSRDVWGGHYAYLVSVDSTVDAGVTNYKTTKRFTYDQMYNLLESRLGISPDEDPEDWFEILTYTDGDYVGNIRVCGYTTSPKTGSKLTGRYLRENVLSLRSASFDVEYDYGSDSFTFTVYGYGHGVGLSQNGANVYANQGWDYVEILTHYYPGTDVF